jgi:hypothetical protein
MRSFYCDWNFKSMTWDLFLCISFDEAHKLKCKHIKRSIWERSMMSLVEHWWGVLKSGNTGLPVLVFYCFSCLFTELKVTSNFVSVFHLISRQGPVTVIWLPIVKIKNWQNLFWLKLQFLSTKPTNNLF